MPNFPEPHFSEYVEQVRDAGRSLTRAQANAALCAMLAGEATDDQIAALLTAMARRGETGGETAIETVDELTGFAEAMRSLSVPVPLTEAERAALVDTCGTGGDGSGTFNISTASALVAAAAGAKVAKHGNRAVTSKCGSADVLEALGVPVALPVEAAAECLRTTGFMFLYAPLLHPAMKRVGPVRRALGFRTIFNLAGPLANPAGARAQVMGVFAADRVALAAEAMANLGVRHAFVVHGLDGLDEFTLSGETLVAEVVAQGAGGRAQGPGHREQGTEDSGAENFGVVRHFRFHPRDVGLALASLDQLRGGETAAENAAILEAILLGETGPRRDIVLLNAAAALLVSGIASGFREGVERAAAAIDSGAAKKTLAALREFGRKFGSVQV
jgi:anthranilate phosphoribosyltransferase